MHPLGCGLNQGQVKVNIPIFCTKLNVMLTLTMHHKILRIHVVQNQSLKTSRPTICAHTASQ